MCHIGDKEVYDESTYDELIDTSMWLDKINCHGIWMDGIIGTPDNTNSKQKC